MSSLCFKSTSLSLISSRVFYLPHFKQHFRYLCHLACKGTIKPIISTCVPLKRVASVQRAIELGETAYGVCVCRPWADEGDAASSKKVAADSEKASSN